MADKPVKKFPTIAACGLDCGMCPRYYTQGKSRCPGCCGPGFFEKHPTCSVITCCVKKQGLETCAECREYPCKKYKTEADYRRMETSAYPPYRNVLRNLQLIKQNSLKAFVAQQKKCIKILEKMIIGFDDGRSRSFYCRAAALLDIADLDHVLQSMSVKPVDKKVKAMALRQALEAKASRRGIGLSRTRK